MIRKFKSEEIPHLVEIWELGHRKAHHFLEESFTSMVKAAMENTYLPGSNTLVYEFEGRVLGFITMVGHEIAGLFVHPENHGQGVGRSLVHHVNQDQETIEVEVFDKNTIGKPFYLKNGFTAISAYIDEATNEKVWRMRKS